MMESRRAFGLMLAFVLAMGLAAAAQSSAGNELNLGVQAYRQARYHEAIQHFEKAIAQDAGNGVAHLYLATAYAQQYIPGADTPDNNQLAERAVVQYKKVIDLNYSTGATRGAVQGIAYLLLQMKRFDEAKDYYRKAKDLDPNDPEPCYSIGVIDWTETYEPRQDERAKLNLDPTDSLPDKDGKVCAMLREKNWAKIDEGIESLNKALQLRPDYDDAMAYMNLMYRERADVQCDDPAARQDDLKTADEWVDKTLATKKTKAEKADKQQGSPAPEQ